MAAIFKPLSDHESESVVVMASLVKDFSFPLFSFVVDTEKPSTGHFLCLYQVKGAKPGSFCGHVEESFDEMQKHLATGHSCQLKETIDFCSKCKYIFESKLMAVSHWLTHLIELEEKEAILEPYDKATLDFVLEPVMDILKQQREIVMQHILFEGQDPGIDGFEI